ncbi:MAG TPA: hypothetical protein DDZ60_12170 [Planktothrix sp. UBA10369]|nr:hypothetical protein [Planktothrix sp. UBA10369]
MTLDLSLINQIESLRIPLDDSESPLDWKDWYHYILIHPKTGMRILVNITLMGRPQRGEIQVSLIINSPNYLLPTSLQTTDLIATFATAISIPWKANNVCSQPLEIQAKGVHLKINGEQSKIQVWDERSQLSINFKTQAKATPLLVTEDAQFGSGFIGWGLIPGLEVLGEFSIGKTQFNLNSDWFCYHDRNFGRFRWGEDIGWEWFVIFAQTETKIPLTLILDWRTNKTHSQGGLPYIFIYQNHQLRKIFLGESLRLNWHWSKVSYQPLRLPGIMASLFSDRSLKMPQSLQIQAQDEQDHLLLNLNFDTTLELIVPDNQSRQYTFIEELSGTVEMHLNLNQTQLTAQGFVYAEYVH